MREPQDTPAHTDTLPDGSSLSPAYLDAIFAEHGVEATVSLLAQHFWDKPSDLVAASNACASLHVTHTKVKTVAIFFHALGIGGGERVTRDLIRIWLDMGLKVILLTNVPPQEGDYKLPDGVERIVLPSFVGMTQHSYPQRCRALLDVLRTHDVDVLVFAHWFSDTLAFDMLCARGLGIRTYLYIQSSFTLFFLDRDLPSQYADIPLQYALANGIICLSEMDQLFWSNFNANVHVMNNPVTLQPSTSAAKLEGHTIIWPARLHVDKLPSRVVPIMKSLVQKVPDAQILMVGPEDPTVAQDVRKLAEEASVLEHLTFCGPQPEEAMTEFYARADAFLLTSQREGWSIALGEALALGLPCVIYDLPYLTLAHNDGVLSVPQGDAEAAAHALAKVLTNKELAHGMGEAGKAFMQDVARFDHKKFWSELFATTPGEDVPFPHTPTNTIMWSELLNAYRAHLASFELERQQAAARETQLLENLERKAWFLAQEKERLEHQLISVKEELAAVRESTSLKTGLVITYLPRMIKKLLSK